MAVSNINLSRVNISLAEFQRMSDGKYNAGEVKLSALAGLEVWKFGSLELCLDNRVEHVEGRYHFNGIETTGKRSK